MPRPSQPISFEWLRKMSLENPNTGCWEWSLSKNQYGYGRVKIGKKTKQTHRLMMVFTGHELKDSDFVCHKCDNPCCCNPLHLWVGTPSENSKDAYAKNRIVPPTTRAVGENSGKATINEAQARLILRLNKIEGLKPSRIGKLLGINRKTVGLVTRNQTWKHVTI